MDAIDQGFVRGAVEGCFFEGEVDYYDCDRGDYNG
jgi:hypothetical protein